MGVQRLIKASAVIFALYSYEAHGCGKTSVMSATTDDGGTVELILDAVRLKQTPAWSPGLGEPPLSVADAISIAMNWASKKYVRFDGVEIREISLTSLGCKSNRDHWYYIFDFSPVLGGNRMYGAGNWAAVLMDGTIVETTSKASDLP